MSLADTQDFLQLITQGHPNGKEKLAPGVERIIKGIEVHGTYCYMLVRPDGSQESVSYVKCVKGLFGSHR